MSSVSLASTCFDPLTEAAGLKGKIPPVTHPVEHHPDGEGRDVNAIDKRAGLRDRALLGVMVYSFARVSAVVGMSRIITSRANAGGCACRKEAASSIRCRSTTRRRNISTPISRPRRCGR